MQAETVGPYRILGELGRGAMGVVLRAYDPGLGREVALKLMASGARGPGFERFRREAESLARLQHPHVIGVHAVGEHAGRPYLVMPLVAGESLQALLEREGVLPFERVAQLGQQLASALAHVHALGLLHRDVKPANVLLDREGSPRLTDFGLVKDLQSTTDALSKTGAMMGTPGYWSPEQAAGEGTRVGPATDVYGLGATLYALVTGQPPTPQSMGPAAVVATVTRPPVPPRAQRADTPRDLERILLRCLEKDPARRYADGAALVDDLQRYLRGAPLARAPRGPMARAVALGVALTLTALAGLGLIGWRRVGAAAPAPAASVEARAATPAAKLADQAWERCVAGSLTEALARVDQALTLDPTCAAAWRERARLALLDSDPVAARDACRRALALEPEHALGLARLARALQTLGEEREALAAAERAVAADAACGEAATTLGALWVTREATREEGLRRGVAGAALAPDAPDVFTLLAEARLLAGDAAGALSACDRAFDRAPNFPGARAQRVRVLEQSRDRSAAALREADGLVQDQPQWGLAWGLRGWARWRRGDAEAGLADLDHALTLRPDSPELRGWRARAHADAGRFADDERDLSAALEVAPGLARLRVDRAVARINQGDWAGALEDYDVLIARGQVDVPSPGIAYALRAAARVALADHAGAEEDFERYTRLAPQEVNAWVQLAILRRYRGDPQGALRAWDQAIDLGPVDATMLSGRGEVRAELGDPAGAVEDYRRAVKLEPAHERRLLELEAALRPE